jgi:protein O-GlcNAc transferase
MRTPSNPLRHATELRRFGRLAEARAVYASALREAPQHVEILRQWGTLEMQMGQPVTAAQMLSQALALKPDVPEIYYEMGSALAMLGRVDEAIAHFNEAIRLKPRYPEAFIGLGRLALIGKQFEVAESHFAKAVAQKPDNGEALYGLGLAQLSQNKWVEAERNLFKASRQNPKHPAVRYNLAKAQRDCGKLAEAVASYREAAKLDPKNADIFNNLGTVLKDLGHHDEAAAALRQALQLRPNWPEACHNLGLVQKAQGLLDEASVNFEAAIRFKPDFPDAINTLGNVYKEKGDLDGSIDLYRQTLVVAPDYAEAHCNLGVALASQGHIESAIGSLIQAKVVDSSNSETHRRLINTLLYSNKISESERFNYHTEYANYFTSYSPVKLKNISLDQNRKLRLGFVSSDFRSHSVARNFLPFINAHDRSKFEIYFYAEVKIIDSATTQFKEIANGWRFTCGLSDAVVAEMICADKIDILVFLAGHFDENRPSIALYKPAPIQISFHDPATSGLPSMDYIIADPVLIPRHAKERFVERPLRLPSYYLHAPIQDAPEVTDLPALKNGYITFGAFHNPAKLNDDVLELWGRVLSAVPNSRLVLKYKNWFTSKELRNRVHKNICENNNILQDRIDFINNSSNIIDHLSQYKNIDISLDSFPFCGSTASFETLWMGVPPITLLGNYMVGRWTASILRTLKLDRFVAASPDEFVKVAVAAAKDLEGLAELRRSLRAMVSGSSLCDAEKKAKEMQRLYRAIWSRWCKRQSGGR